jgi:hypothetical protein
MDDQHAYLACSTERFLSRPDRRLKLSNIVSESSAEPAGLKKIPLHVDDYESGFVQIDGQRCRFCFQFDAVHAESLAGFSSQKLCKDQATTAAERLLNN